MNAFALSPSEGFLLELVLKGALLMAAAFGITFVFRRRSAALRHAVWSLAFVGLLLLPLGSALLPAWQIPMPRFVTASAVGRQSVEPAPQFEAAHRATVEGAARVQGSATQGPATQGPAKQGPAIAQGPAEAQGPAITQEPAIIQGPATAQEPIVSADAGEGLALIPGSAWMRVVSLLWVLGAAALLIRLALVLGKLSLLRRVAEPVADPTWTDQAECIAEAFGIRRPIQLLQHADVAVPMTYGVRRPVIFLPNYANGWSREQMHVTLMHELLHVKRYDHLVQVLALSARALHWFNPLTWMAAKRLIVERERACDDGVLSMGVASSSYADHLLGMARHILSNREASSAALAMARPSELHTRIVAILDPAMPRRTPSRWRVLTITGCAVILFVSLAAMQPASNARPVSGSDETEEVVDTPAEASEREGADVQIVESLQDEVEIIAADGIAQDARTSNKTADGIAHDAPTSNEAAEIAWMDTTEVEAQKRAIHAISELPEARSVPLLTEIARTHQNPELRKEAVFWLGQVGAASIGELLESIARTDADPELQKQALFALAELDDRRGIPALTGLARTHPNDEMRAEAVFWLGEGGGPEAVDALETFALNDESLEVQKKAVFALAEVEDGAGVSSLIELARTHPNPEVRSDAIFWLGESGDERAADVLMDIVNQN